MRVAAGEIVGTYRMLPPERARAAGALYAEGEFVIDDLAPLRRSLLETGRWCVHRDHRSGAVIGLVWAGRCQGRRGDRGPRRGGGPDRSPGHLMAGTGRAAPGWVNRRPGPRVASG